MARVVFVLAFSLVLVLSIRAVLGEGPTAATVGDQIGQAASDVKDKVSSLSGSAGDQIGQAASATKDGVSSLSSSAGDMLKDTKVTVEESSWGNWFKDKLQDMGLASDQQPAAEKAQSPPSA